MTRASVVLLVGLAAVQVAAHHPGDGIDAAMAQREPAFEAVDLRRAPALRGVGEDGAIVRLDALSDRIVVLHFAPGGCGAPCAAQGARLRDAQAAVDATPMRQLVSFLVAGPPAGPADGAAQVDAGWTQVALEDGAADAAARFAATSRRKADAPMIHVIDRGGRHAAIFHGAAFDPVNLILYVNALTNAPPPEPGWLDRVLEALR